MNSRKQKKILKANQQHIQFAQTLAGVQQNVSLSVREKTILANFEARYQALITNLYEIVSVLDWISEDETEAWLNSGIRFQKLFDDFYQFQKEFLKFCEIDKTNEDLIKLQIKVKVFYARLIYLSESYLRLLRLDQAEYIYEGLSHIHSTEYAIFQEDAEQVISFSIFFYCLQAYGELVFYNSIITIDEALQKEMYFVFSKLKELTRELGDYFLKKLETQGVKLPDDPLDLELLGLKKLGEKFDAEMKSVKEWESEGECSSNCVSIALSQL